MAEAKDSLEISRKPFVNVTNDFSGATTSDTAIIWEPDPNRVVPQSFQADYYRIQINTFGWYNIDRFIDESTESELFVKLTGSHSSKNQVFLAILSIKLMLEGGWLEDSSSIGFYTKDGKIPLMQGKEAFVFALGESPDNPQLYFGFTKFVTSTSQMVNVKMQPLSQDELQQKLNSFNFSNFKGEVVRDSTKENIRSLDLKLDKLRDKLKNCDCEPQHAAVDSTGVEESYMSPR